MIYFKSHEYFLRSRQIDNPCRVVVIGTCNRFQTIDFFSEPEYPDKSKYECLFEIDDLLRGNDRFMLCFFAKQLNQKDIVSASTGNEDLSFGELIGGTGQLVRNMFIK